MLFLQKKKKIFNLLDWICKNNTPGKNKCLYKII